MKGSQRKKDTGYLRRGRAVLDSRRVRLEPEPPEKATEVNAFLDVTALQTGRMSLTNRLARRKARGEVVVAHTAVGRDEPITETEVTPYQSAVRFYQPGSDRQGMLLYPNPSISALPLRPNPDVGDGKESIQPANPVYVGESALMIDVQFRHARDSLPPDSIEQIETAKIRNLYMQPSENATGAGVRHGYKAEHLQSGPELLRARNPNAIASIRADLSRIKESDIEQAKSPLHVSQEQLRVDPKRIFG